MCFCGNVQFIGIGAARAGSSWLWKQLRRHEEIWMPPIKELHYFDRSPLYPSPSYLASDSISQRLFGQNPRNQEFRRRLFRELVKDVVWLRPSNLAWTRRYFLESCSDEWYKSLFEPSGSRLAGEITPAYSILTREDVSSIKQLLPGLKIIFLVRNPIERAWSHVRYDYKTGKVSDLSDMKEVKPVIDSESQELRSDYLRSYRIWTDVFGKRQVHVDFYDRIRESPQTLLTEVGEFLALSDPEGLYKERRSDRRVNASPKSDMPDEIRSYVTRKYIGDLREMADIFGGYAKKWVGEAEKAL